jgi:collagenase-like PrtC family protease
LHGIFFYFYSDRCLSSEYTNIKIKNQKFVFNKKIRIYKIFYFLLFVSMHEHGCLDFHIQNKNLYKTEQKKVNSAIWKKKVDYHLSKTELKNKYWNIQIVAHLKRFCWTHHLSKSYEK